ncbi:staygreen family protein [Cytobacillus suaedae]|nr:staygreen family protein [Cytobacillus suaedae]
MSKLNPSKLSVEFKDGVTPLFPTFHRRHTLTHSDETGELFLTIGIQFAYEKINITMRDEVLGEWVNVHGEWMYYIHLYVDGGEFDQNTVKIRNTIFRRELPLALEAIRYGDQTFFHAYPWLDYSPIIVHFLSSSSEYNKVEYWGQFSNYRVM